MKSKMILTFAVLTILGTTLRAGEVPDMVWRTNAHPNLTSDIEFLPDSRSLVSASFTGAAMLWSVSNTALHRSFSIPQDHVVAIALSPDGTRLMGRGGSAGLRLWRVSDGTVLYANDPSGGTSLAFSPTGNLVARGRDTGSIYLTRINGESVTGSVAYDDVHLGGVNAVAFSPDGSLLLSGGNDSTAKLMRVSDGVVFQTFGHSLYVLSVAFSPNGKTIATGTHAGDVRLWSTNGTLLHTLGTGGPTRSMDFSPDGKLLATTSGDLVHFWSVSDGIPLVTYDPDPAGQVSAVRISPDEKLFAYGTGLGAVVLARMPVLLTKPEKRANEFNFDWQGGSGLYQVQQTTSVTSAVWANLGPPSAATNLAVPMTNATAFFRVQSLTNAP